MNYKCKKNTEKLYFLISSLIELMISKRMIRMIKSKLMKIVREFILRRIYRVKDMKLNLWVSRIMFGLIVLYSSIIRRNSKNLFKTKILEAPIIATFISIHLILLNSLGHNTNKEEFQANLNRLQIDHLFMMFLLLLLLLLHYILMLFIPCNFIILLLQHLYP